SRPTLKLALLTVKIVLVPAPPSTAPPPFQPEMVKESLPIPPFRRPSPSQLLIRKVSLPEPPSRVAVPYQLFTVKRLALVPPVNWRSSRKVNCNWPKPTRSSVSSPTVKLTLFTATRLSWPAPPSTVPAPFQPVTSKRSSPLPPRRTPLLTQFWIRIVSRPAAPSKTPVPSQPLMVIVLLPMPPVNTACSRRYSVRSA